MFTALQRKKATARRFVLKVGSRRKAIVPRVTRSLRHRSARAGMDNLPSDQLDLIREEYENPGSRIAATQPETVLSELRARIARRDVLIPIQASLALTKSTGDTASAVLMRDFSTESKAFGLLESRVNTDVVIQRFRTHEPSLPEPFWPQHYPVRVVTGAGVVTSGRNVFLFFPEVLGIKADRVDETFGFELIDVWRSIFEQTIFPCLPKVFDVASQVTILGSLMPALDEIIYLASAFHEVSHRTGPFAISPKIREPIRVTPFQWSVGGELSTDALFSGLVREVPELALFVFMQRVFAYGRRGFSDRPLTAGLNSDNDSWIGSYLWTKARKEHLIVPSKEEPGRWHLNAQKLSEFFAAVSQEVDHVGNRSERHFTEWMNCWVPTDRAGTFQLSTEFRRVLHACSGVPEYPHYQPMLRR